SSSQNGISRRELSPIPAFSASTIWLTLCALGLKGAILPLSSSTKQWSRNSYHRGGFYHFLGIHYATSPQDCTNSRAHSKGAAGFSIRARSQARRSWRVSTRRAHCPASLSSARIVRQASSKLAPAPLSLARKRKP